MGCSEYLCPNKMFEHDRTAVIFVWIVRQFIQTFCLNITFGKNKFKTNFVYESIKINHIKYAKVLQYPNIR